MPEPLEHSTRNPENSPGDPHSMRHNTKNCLSIRKLTANSNDHRRRRADTTEAVANPNRYLRITCREPKRLSNKAAKLDTTIGVDKAKSAVVEARTRFQRSATTRCPLAVDEAATQVVQSIRHRLGLGKIRDAGNPTDDGQHIVAYQDTPIAEGRDTITSRSGRTLAFPGSERKVKSPSPRRKENGRASITIEKRNPTGR